MQSLEISCYGNGATPWNQEAQDLMIMTLYDVIYSTSDFDFYRQLAFHPLAIQDLQVHD